ncbi:hypothetical protein UFOVP764_18 [uncultured Caudovirales phage]|uniref:Uncharacterized protein n=1 Tax=uncultured Caudovirales phage TaxID=2100421 RepID=A0A6J5NT44_9CAUD|nr:hypothetical protein UFOVP764_18 [uncultured Caudovirales phage]
MDYAALAKQYGGTSTPPIDYAALASQFGAVDPLAARVAKIPGGATQAPAAKPERSAIDVLGGVLETPLALTSGAVGGLVRPVATMVGELSSPYPQGSPQATAAGQRVMQAASRGLYSPQTQTGQDIMSGMSEALGFLPPMQPMGTLTATANALAAPAMRQATDATAQGAQRATAPIRNALTRANQQMSGMGAANTAEELLRAERLQRLNIPSTLGERTKNLPQQQFEADVQRGVVAGIPDEAKTAVSEQMRSFKENQRRSIVNNFERMTDEVGAQVVEPRQVGRVVDQALNEQYSKKYDAYKALYKQADEAGETLQPVAYQPLLDFINTKTPTARKTLDPILDSVAEALAMNDPSKTGQITVRALEDIYQQIGKVKTSANAGQLKSIITEIGDGVGGELYQAARQARRQLAREFEDVSRVDKLLGTKAGYVDRRVALDDVFKHVVLDGSLEEMRTVTSLLKKGGPTGRQAYAELQGQTLQHMKELLTKGDGMSFRNLNNLVTQLDSEGKLTYMFGKTGRDQILDLRDAIKDVIVKQPGAVNYSNTSGAVLRGLEALQSLRVPLVANLATFARTREVKGKVSEALKQPNQLAPKSTNNLAP